MHAPPPYLHSVALVGRAPDEALPCLPVPRPCAATMSTPRPPTCGWPKRLRRTVDNEEAADEFRAPRCHPGPLSPCVDYGLGALAAVGGDWPPQEDAPDPVCQRSSNPKEGNRPTVNRVAAARRGAGR